MTSILDLSILSAQQGFTIKRATADDDTGTSVSSAGDVNGDGIADILVGAPKADGNGVDAGAAYVVFGKAGATGADIDLANLAAANGYTIRGGAAGDAAGSSLSSAGDINGDGIADLIVGAPLVDEGGTEAGQAYVIFGKAGGTRASIDLATLAPADGFSIKGDLAFDKAASSISAAGDINGDGLADLIIGAYRSDAGANDAGAAYVVFGKAGATGTNLDLGNLAPTDGYRIAGKSELDLAGTSVSSAGDINGDGIADLIVGVPLKDGVGRDAGAAYVIFGKSGATRGDINLGTISAQDGFAIEGGQVDGEAGYKVSSAGDVNGDGFDDLIVGAPGSGSYYGKYDAGHAYVVFGKAGATRANIELASFGANDGFVIQGDAAGDYTGASVASAGDINGDGFDDLIVSAPGGGYLGSNEGNVYVVFGKAGSTRANIDLTNLAPADGFRITEDFVSARVSSAGDVNEDGFDDLLIGDAKYGVGNAYVVFGRADFATDTPPVIISPPTASFAENGMGTAYRITGTDADAGTALRFAITGRNANLFNVDSETGAVTFKRAPDFEKPATGSNIYIINVHASGSVFSAVREVTMTVTDVPDAVDRRGTSKDDTLTGTNFDDTLAGLAGNDVLDGGVGADKMVGGTGNDSYVVDNVGDRVIEKVDEGIDTVTSNINYTAAANVENLTLSGDNAINGRGNALNNTIRGNDAANALDGLDGNDTLDGGGGADTMRGSNGNDAYFVDNIGDKVIERAGEGTESVITTVSYALRANVENLRLSGTAAINGTGNGLNNFVRGNGAANVLSGLDGDDTLVGGAGADRLFGGAGKDAFRFDVREISANRDVIRDFVHGVDTIELSRSMFKAFSGDPVGAVSASELVFGTAATTSSHHLIYNIVNGALFYDADGAGGVAQVQIAVLITKPALDAADIVLV